MNTHIPTLQAWECISRDQHPKRARVGLWMGIFRAGQPQRIGLQDIIVVVIFERVTWFGLKE